MNGEHPSHDWTSFNDPDAIFDSFTPADTARLAHTAGDLMLAVDEDGIVRDVSAGMHQHGFATEYLGRRWVDTVSSESRPKIEELLAGNGRDPHVWRQVNHLNDGEYIPVSYRLLRPIAGGMAIAIGRDQRALALLQQRLLKTQQSMERDYLHLRQTETRYRLLFDIIAYPVLMVDGDTLVVQQANRACHALLALPPGSLDGKSLLTLVEPVSRDDVSAYIGAIAVNSATAPVSVRLANRPGYVRLSAVAFRQAGKQHWLITIDDGLHEVPGKQSDRHILDMVDQMPDAFVVTDEKQAIIVANRAFADLVQAGSVEQLVGASLGRFIGRPDVDLNLLKKQLREHGTIRNFGSILVDLTGRDEPVEISAVMVERNHALFGYAIRSVGRRERDLPPGGQDYPRSVDQLTELVGRKPLKEIVRESTDLIERMCIEAALVHTSDNRASAAEILGLSRQSLYSKLHRHGLGHLIGRD
jgi:transcriptional regulator PpsR